MAIAASARIHPTAIISADATIGERTTIGPYVIIDGPVTLGDDCVVSAHAHLIGPLTMGRGNFVGSSAVLGADPQHLAYAGQPTRLEIGDGNTFREHVTIHRGSHVEQVTLVGNKNYFMVNSHVGHDSIVGNNCIFANGALIAGHCRIDDNVFCSGNICVHQFARMGRYSLVSGGGLVLQDLLPFMICYGRAFVGGVNVVGMRRAGFARSEIDVVRKVYQMIYRNDSPVKIALQQVENEFGTSPAVAEIVAFAKGTKRGILSRSGHDVDE